MFGKLAFQAEAKLQILNGDVLIPPTRPPPLVNLLKELLVVNPLQRPDILTVLRRLQEVADAMNVDPALLVPRQSSTQSSGEAQQASLVRRNGSLCLLWKACIACVTCVQRMRLLLLASTV